MLNAQEEKNKNEKLYRKLGMCIGMAIVIILMWCPLGTVLFGHFIFGHFCPKVTEVWKGGALYEYRFVI